MRNVTLFFVENGYLYNNHGKMITYGHFMPLIKGGFCLRPKPDLAEITLKLEDLCTTILNQPAYKELKKMVEDFLADDNAMKQYNGLFNKQRTLQQRQQSGLQLTQADIDDFEQDRYNLYSNPVTRDFMYAQQEFDKVQSLVGRYLVKTIELDRLPTEEELEDTGGCGCGGSCGCGGH
jgi:cell fate (sporulation/competence/biofilm development) regulator YlbF (YheA/YmcA/DUF963 family)